MNETTQTQIERLGVELLQAYRGLDAPVKELQALSQEVIDPADMDYFLSVVTPALVSNFELKTKLLVRELEVTAKRINRRRNDRDRELIRR